MRNDYSESETTYEEDITFLEQQEDLFICGPYLYQGDGQLPPEVAKEARRFVECVQARESQEEQDNEDSGAIG